MTIRPSFIATRFAGVETYQFAHDPRSFRIIPDGPLYLAIVGDYGLIDRGCRSDCLAAIIAESVYSI